MTVATIEVLVAEKREEAQGICTFELVAKDGAALPAFSAGAHIDVHIADGLVRQYSLCNQADGKGDAGGYRHYLIGVLRDPKSRGGSAALHSHIAQGDILRISPPRNHFPLVHGDRFLLFAGGIGVTPILCMAERLAQAGKPFEMHYSARSAERMAFRQRILDAPFASLIKLYVDEDPAGARLDLADVIAPWSGSLDQLGTHIYVCGPGGYIDFLVSHAKAQGWPASNMHLEHFGSVAQGHQGDRAFRLKLASSGRIIEVAADVTVAAALLEQGVDIPLSCEQGVCGVCITGVLEGIPEHRDVCLSEAEQAANDRFTPCCSRAKTPVLVLDL
jgi:vanillate O-demethylase ferredoxin subunit